jgi:hypothetical protein
MAVPFSQNPAEPTATQSPDAPRSVAPQLTSTDRLVALLSATGGGDRRESQRYSFPVVAGAAPCWGAAAPTEADFQVVCCHNLSTLGISFYWPTVPNFDQVIVSLALPHGTLKLLARVIFHRLQAGHEGQHLIGCRFVRRADVVSRH